MNIAIIARNPDLYSHCRLVEAGEMRGHTMRIISPLQCYMNISEDKPTMHYRGGEILEDIDAVIPRIGASQTFYGTAVVRQFEMMGVYTLNGSIAIARSRDKLRSLQILSRKNIPMPITGFAHSPLDTEDLIQMVGGAPLIIKLLEGTQGKGVVLAETKAAATSVIGAFKQMNANLLVQQYIKESNGSDIRCFVIGNEVVASIMRTAKEGEFRSNLHQGGSGQLVDLTAEERQIAITATKVLGLRVAGVDLIRSARGPLVLEVNSSPGLEGVETITGKDIAGSIINFIENALLEHHAHVSPAQHTIDA
ncbi:MAG: 30S ribosomal protein S6--L-glutamate ligase [Gammaproteobacteria bacterium]|nr:30S ribosomal protein S6--L-glutamate ligase [Gammaproteobacteria bacterium]